MADVPKEEAAILLYGYDTDWQPVERWLDTPPSFDDTKNMVVVHVQGLRPIFRKRLRSIIK